jgi:hypothetical protein
MAKNGFANAANDFKLGIKRGKSGPCKEVIMRGDDIDLTKIPVLTCWPDDGGPFVTLPMVFTHNPNTGRRNVGMYRVQIYDKNTTGMHWQTHKVAAQHHREAPKKGKTSKPLCAWAAIHACRFALWRLCRKRSTKCFSPVFCAESPSKWCNAKPLMFKFPPIANTFWKVISNPANSAMKVHLVTIPDITRLSNRIPFFT